MTHTHLNTRLSQPLAAYVASQVSEAGPYATADDYVCDLIRRDMEQRETQAIEASISAAYADVAAGRLFASTGDFRQDLKIFAQKEAQEWR